MAAKAKASIIGVGCTRFGSVLSTPELKDLTFQELITKAVHEAVSDAGINPRDDIDALYIGNYNVDNIHQYSHNTQTMDWLGLNLKPSLNFATACSTTNTGLGLAAMSIMSGKHKCCLVTAGEILTAQPVENMQTSAANPLARKEASTAEIFYWTLWGVDQVYNQYGVTSGFAEYGPLQMVEYAKRYGLSADKMDELEFMIRRANRKHGSMNPRAFFYGQTLEQEAKKAGFKDALKYWKSNNNPVSVWPQRARAFLTPADGASAFIVCDTKLAKKLTKNIPVDILGWEWSGSNMPLIGEDTLNYPFDVISTKGAMKNAKITAKDIDYLYCHDCSATIGHVITPEMIGYLPKGKGWKAVEEGRTMYNGDKPIATSGGRNAFGHAYTCSAGAELYEAVMQIRGKAGKRQIKPYPKTAVLQNHGAMLHSATTVIKRR